MRENPRLRVDSPRARAELRNQLLIWLRNQLLIWEFTPARVRDCDVPAVSSVTYDLRQ